MSVTLDQLVALLPPEHVYPSGKVVPISPRIKGRSFFPGGCGLAFGGEQPYPRRPIMLVGQDFGTRSYWEGLTPSDQLRGEPDSSGTWKHLKTWASQGVIPEGRCFFTNVLCGVRDNVSDASIKIYGESPGLGSAEYVRESVECLLRQIDLLQPTAVVGLGRVPVTLLGRALGLVGDSWPSLRLGRAADIATWQEIDDARLQFAPEARTPSGHSFAFASSVHPDRYWLNIKHRRWPANQLSGAQAHDAVWRSVREHDSIVARPTIA